MPWKIDSQHRPSFARFTQTFSDYSLNLNGGEECGRFSNSLEHGYPATNMYSDCVEKFSLSCYQGINICFGHCLSSFINKNCVFYAHWPFCKHE